jgi:hypothetical protein
MSPRLAAGRAVGAWKKRMVVSPPTYAGPLSNMEDDKHFDAIIDDAWNPASDRTRGLFLAGR